MNIKLLEQIKAKILAKPLNFDMERWGAESCLSAHCIGGWAIVLSDCCPVSFESVSSLAAILLELNDGEESRLFYLDEWPEYYENQYHNSDSRRPSQVAADRIDHFIATEGRE